MSGMHHHVPDGRESPDTHAPPSLPDAASSSSLALDAHTASAPPGEHVGHGQPSSATLVSLFSAGTPPTASHGDSTGPTKDAAPVRSAFSSSSSASSSRPLAVLASASGMARRPARLSIVDEQPAIAPLKACLPSAQKDVDDPTTPVESQRPRRGRNYTTLTTLSRLFTGDSTIPASRTPSYNHATVTTEAVSLPEHLFTRGFQEGRHSDITVIAFGQRYNLHRLILDRAPFFTSALSEPWIESKSKEVSLYPEEIDANITQAAFELAIKKLYGRDISHDLHAEAIGLFATGCWLEMQDLIDTSVESILKQMTPNTLAPLIRLVTTNYYGRSGDRILESAKAMLSRNGWEMPLKHWDNMPGDVVREMVASDGFYVHSEWDRWVLAKRLLDRRLRQAALDAGLIERGKRPVPTAPDSLSLMAIRFDAVYRQNSLTSGQSTSDMHSQWIALYTNPDIERILVLLDEGIHYIHMDFEQLDFIRSARDVFGLPVMPEKVISNALWQQLALRQRVLNADESAQELGLCKAAPEPTTTSVRPTSKGKQKALAESAYDEVDIDSGSWEGNGKPRKFWIPSSDCNIVLGNGADPVVTTSNSFQRHATRLSATMQPEDAQWATDFASSPSTMANPNTRTDHPARPLSAGGSNAGQPRPIAYTDFPPFRFSAEFPNPRHLKEKKRVYSRTVSYAGSLWNIYIQKVRSARNVQLGVYLHRAKERESDEQAPSSGLSQHSSRSVDERIGQLEREMLLRSERRDRRRGTRAPLDQAVDEDGSGSGGDVDGTLLSTESSNPLLSSSRHRSGHNSDPAARASSDLEPLGTSPGDAEPNFYPLTMGSASDSPSDFSSSDNGERLSAYPNPSHHRPSSQRRSQRNQACTLPTYVDARPTIKTYFKIYSPSKGGRMLSIYESAPDRFNFSQSWGWKSSTLMLDEGALSLGSNGSANGNGEGAEGEGEGQVLGEEKKKGVGKLRFMVVIGNL